MKRSRSVVLLIVFSIVSIVMILTAVAQTAGGDSTPPATSTLSALSAKLILIIPFIVPALIALIKAEYSKIPTKYLPVLAPVIGGLADALMQWAGLQTPGTLWAVLLGAAGVGIREIYDQWKQPPPPIVVGSGTDAAPPSPKVPLILLIGALSLTVVGCASFISRAQKTENAMAQLADAGMKSWAIYYHDATNNPAKYHKTLAQIEDEHKQVNEVSRRVGASLHTVHVLIASYRTNSAVEPSLQAGIDTLTSAAPELFSLTELLTGNALTENP